MGPCVRRDDDNEAAEWHIFMHGSPHFVSREARICGLILEGATLTIVDGEEH